MAKSPPPPHLNEPLGVLLGTRAKVGLLRILTAQGEPLSQRELARRAALTLRSAQQALADLYAMGVVTQIAGGRDHLSVFNTRHMLANALAALFAAESELARQLRAELVRVSTGNAELGLVAMSQVFVDGKLKAGSAWVVPANLHNPLRQDAVLLVGGKSNPAALQMMAFLKSAQARAIMNSFGYE